MSQDDWVDIGPIFAKPGDQWTSTEKNDVARWLAEEQRPLCLKYGNILLGNIHDAEDAFQDFLIDIKKVMVKGFLIEKVMVKGFPEFDPEKGTAEAFIRKEWRSHLKNYRQRRGRRVSKEQQMPLDEEGKPLVEATDRYPPVPTFVDLKLRLESLPDEQREVIDRRFFHRNGQLKPFKEIAAEIGKSEEAVKKICQRAIKSLRKQADNEDQRTAMIESVPPNKESKMKRSDANNRTD